MYLSGANSWGTNGGRDPEVMRRIDGERSLPEMQRETRAGYVLAGHPPGPSILTTRSFSHGIQRPASHFAKEV